MCDFHATFLSPIESPPALLFAACRFAPCVFVIDEAQLDDQDLREVGDLIRVLVVCPTVVPSLEMRLAAVGCMGCVEEAAPPEVIQEAIEAVGRGEMWFSRHALTGIIRRLRTTRQMAGLTPREREILALIAQGYTNRAIANELQVTYATVRWHLKRIHFKLGVRDRVLTVTCGQHRMAVGSVATPAKWKLA